MITPRFLALPLLLAALPAVAQTLQPLPELGKGLYKGEQGGLYPGGENEPPAAHRSVGMRAAKSIRPLDADGKASPTGKIVMVSTGMSNTTMESQTFASMLSSTPGINPNFQFVDCAQGAQTAMVTAKAESKYWKVAEERLTAAGVTPKQVQVAWIKQANARPTGTFLEEAKRLQNDLAATIGVMHNLYPNLRIVYLSSRIFAGHAVTPLNPEPYAYESGFAVKWVIADQIAGKMDKAPWVAWGPYLWADANTYLREDLAKDGTHPSPSGRQKVAKMLLDFLQKDPSSRPWFVQ